MKSSIITISVVGLLFVFSPEATAMLTVDPDAFPHNTVINDAYTGVTLTTKGVGPSGPMSPIVLALDSAWASTGQRVFGHTGAYADLWGASFFDWLRADFTAGAAQVSLDFIANDSDTNAVLNAWNASGILVDTAMEAGPLTSGQVVTLTVAASNIAYITAEGDPINYTDNWALDNLRFKPIPTPGAFLLGTIGVGLVGWLRIRSAL